MKYDIIAAVNPESLTNDRWSEGIDHHPMSKALVCFLAEHDFKNYNDYFQWKTGGDGDNGETLMYQMDPFFEWLDSQKNTDARYVIDGNVAVMYRPAFGIGWSTQDADPEQSKFMALNGGLARLVEAKDWQGVESLVNSKYPNVHCSDLQALRIEWIKKGTLFEITEFDGCEKIRIRSNDFLYAG